MRSRRLIIGALGLSFPSRSYVGREPGSYPPQLLMPPIQLSIAYEPVEDGWVQARIEELPAVITAAPTRDEARELVLDALRQYLLSLQSEPAVAGCDREPVALTITA